MHIWKILTRTNKPPKFRGPNQKSPDAFVRSFCVDYTIWNDYCYQQSKTAREEGKSSPKLMDKFTKLYTVFLAPYLESGVNLQLITFGSHSSFSPKRLTIGEVTIENTLIKQRFNIKMTSIDGYNEFYAMLKKTIDGDLKLLQIYYIDPYPEYPPDGDGENLPYL